MIVVGVVVHGHVRDGWGRSSGYRRASGRLRGVPQWGCEGVGQFCVRVLRANTFNCAVWGAVVAFTCW